MYESERKRREEGRREESGEEETEKRGRKEASRHSELETRVWGLPIALHLGRCSWLSRY